MVEWVRYHAALGFDRFYLLCNDDDPAAFRAALDGLPDALRAMVLCRPFYGQGRQSDMYRDVLPRARAEADWICILDIDEFLVLRQWPTVADLIAHMEATGTLSLHFHWLYYGHNGHVTRPSGGSVRQHYTRRAMALDPHTKHFSWAGCFETDRIAAAGFPFWHALGDAGWRGFTRRTVLGDAVGPLVADFPATMEAYLTAARSDVIVGHAYVAHFVFKSEEDFARRAARGLGGQFGGQIRWKMLADAGQAGAVLDAMNAVEDRTLADWQGAP